MFDFEAWYRDVGLYIVPDPEENLYQYKKRLMREAANAVLSHLADDGK